MPPLTSPVSHAGLFKICAFCDSSILRSNQTWGEHQASISKLEEAASEGCIFCAQLWEDLKTLHSRPANLALPVHRWSLRRSARISESLCSLVITFRSFGEDVTTPTRTFYTFNNEDLGIPQKATIFGASTDSSPAWNQIKKWFEECERHHPDCRRQSTAAPFVPKRLVDVEPLGLGERMVRVVETGNGVQVDKYVTLSHRWGDSNPCKLTVAKQHQFMTEGIGIEELSLNFEHAVRVTRQLGVRYIWIDSLCIVQEKGGDFHIEGTKMHQIYRNSHCNIAAADAEDSSCGLFRQRTEQDIVPATFQSDSSSQFFEQPGTWVVLPGQLWASQLLQNTLYTRAWVFQERMLSPRILHFSRKQIFWECSTISACETLPLGLPKPVDTMSSMDRNWRLRLQKITAINRDSIAGDADVSLDQFWKQAVRSYTKCDLTNQSDKILAIFGIAKLVGDDLGGEKFEAGMWQHSLHEQLAWRVVDCRTASRAEDLRHNPTWSWASVKGEIELTDRSPNEKRFYVIRNHGGEFIGFEASHIRSLDDPNGPQVSGGKSGHFRAWQHHIAMHGAVVDCRLRKLERTTGWTLDISASTRDDDAFEAFPDEYPGETPTELKLAVLACSKNPLRDPRFPPGQSLDNEKTTYSGTGILLKETDEEARFARVGKFSFRGVSGNMCSFLGVDPSSDGSYERQDQLLGNLSQPMPSESLNFDHYL